MSKKTLNVPTRNATPSNRMMLKCPVAAARGIVARRIARPILLVIRKDRRRCLSIQTPAIRLKSRKGAVMAAFRIPSWRAVPRSRRTAVSGIASSLNCAPKLEMVSDDQSLRKLACRQRLCCGMTSDVD